MVRLRYPKIAACFGGIVLLVVIVSAFMGSGKAWITLFGTDYGYACRKDNIELSRAPGGFFDWFRDFANREYEKKEFGLGYGYQHESPEEGQEINTLGLPENEVLFEGHLQIMTLPMWMPIAIMFGIALLFVRISTKSPHKLMP